MQSVSAHALAASCVWLAAIAATATYAAGLVEMELLFTVSSLQYVAEIE